MLGNLRWISNLVRVCCADPAHGAPQISASTNGMWISTEEFAWMSFLSGLQWTLALVHYTLQLFQDSSVCPCAPTSLHKTTLCCSLHIAPSVAGRSGCSCSHGHRAFVALATMPSPDCLADLPGSFCTAVQKPDLSVLSQYFIQATHLPQAFQAYCPCLLRATSDSATCSALL